MNEKQQYAEMLEIPVNTCNITVKPQKRKRTKKAKAEDVKDKLLQKVNNAVEDAEVSPEKEPELDLQPVLEQEQSVVIKKAEKKRFKLSFIGCELFVMGVLIATIFLTSAINPNSGINVFFKNVFKGESSSVVDSRIYSDFAPVISNGLTGEYQDGEIAVSGTGNIYSSINGKVQSLTFDESSKKYTIKVEHNANFISVFSGIDYAYANVGDKVYNNIPIGYALDGGIKMCFLGGDGSVISNYTLDGNAVIWAV